MATYQIDTAHTAAFFKIRHMMIANVRGEFANVSGTIDFDPANPGASRIDATIDANSLSTGQAPRDEHLKKADFLDVEKHPTITFKSKSVSPDSGGFKATGDLTLRGITKEVTLKVEGPSGEIKDPWGMMRRGASASTTFPKKDFGIVFNAPLEGGGFMLGEDIEITLDIEMTRKP
jgi:polyisoprenoid-binding protein YceI